MLGGAIYSQIQRIEQTQFDPSSSSLALTEMICACRTLITNTHFMKSKIRVQSARGGEALASGVDLTHENMGATKRYLYLHHCQFLDSQAIVGSLGRGSSKGVISVSTVNNQQAMATSLTSIVEVAYCVFSRIQHTVDAPTRDCLIGVYQEGTLASMGACDISTSFIQSTIVDVKVIGVEGICTSSISVERIWAYSHDLISGLVIENAPTVAFMWWTGVANQVSTIDVHQSQFIAIPTRALILEANTNSVFATISNSMFLNVTAHDGRGGAVVAAQITNVTMDRLLVVNNRALTGCVLISQARDVIIINSAWHQNRGDGHALLLEGVGSLKVISSVIDCNSNEISVMYDEKKPDPFPNDSVWSCPPGSPFHWISKPTIGSGRGSCIPCVPGEIDSSLMTARLNITSGVMPDCRPCHSPAICQASKIVIPRGWHGMVKTTKQDNGLTVYDLVTSITPNSYGCVDSDECDWLSSCAKGRDINVPFCGACLSGYSEAFGTGTCDCISVTWRSYVLYINRCQRASHCS
jgi:hypothetical protein